MDNYIDNSNLDGKWLYAWKQYEHWDIVEFNEYKPLSYNQLYKLDDYNRKRVYCNWYDIRYPCWNLVYVNHNKYYNCEVVFNRKYILLVANQTIRKKDEITINYWESTLNTVF